MTDIEQRLREAYESQHLPAPVRARTLAAIEEARRCQEGGGRVVSPPAVRWPFLTGRGSRGGEPVLAPRPFPR